MAEYDNPPTAPLADCNEIWLYILVMCKGIMASLASIMFTGWYKYKDKSKAYDMQALAKYLEQVEKDMREKAEALTGWEG